MQQSINVKNVISQAVFLTLLIDWEGMIDSAEFIAEKIEWIKKR
jgi:hypothetical protein